MVKRIGDIEENDYNINCQSRSKVLWLFYVYDVLQIVEKLKYRNTFTSCSSLDIISNVHDKPPATDPTQLSPQQEFVAKQYFYGLNDIISN